MTRDPDNRAKDTDYPSGRSHSHDVLAQIGPQRRLDQATDQATDRTKPQTRPQTGPSHRPGHRPDQRPATRSAIRPATDLLSGPAHKPPRQARHIQSLVGAIPRTHAQQTGPVEGRAPQSAYHQYDSADPRDPPPPPPSRRRRVDGQRGAAGRTRTIPTSPVIARGLTFRPEQPPRTGGNLLRTAVIPPPPPLRPPQVRMVTLQRVAAAPDAAAAAAAAAVAHPCSSDPPPRYDVT